MGGVTQKGPQWPESLLYQKKGNKKNYSKKSVSYQMKDGCTCASFSMTMTILQSKIQVFHKIEKYIATKNSKLKKHSMKWRGFLCK